MIRRELPAEGALPPQWVLIAQIDHARLAGRLAEQWGAAGFAALEPNRELLWAIFHHDDGWHDWDQSPEIDPMTGLPRSFTEMQPADSIEIWRRSIAAAEQIGPLEAWLVASHFHALAQRAAVLPGPWQDEPGTRFVAACAVHSPVWLQAWQARNSQSNTEAVARRALAFLQFFDALSLWFCCTPSGETEEVETPGGPKLWLVPESPGQTASATTAAVGVSLWPWPFRSGVPVPEPINIEVTGRQLSAQLFVRQADFDDQWEQAAVDNRRLVWDLKPGSGPAA